MPACFYVLLDIIGPDEFVMFAEPVIFPLIVEFVMFAVLVILVPVWFPIIVCAFAELAPMATNSEMTAARTGRIITIALSIFI